MTAPREIGVPFTPAMVRAILAFRKTRTRRLVKTQPGEHCRPWKKDGLWKWVIDATGHGVSDFFKCPYGNAGDVLWVREPWRVGKGYDDLAGSQFVSPTIRYETNGGAPGTIMGRYRHARFMPRWACRLFLDVSADPTIERLRDITDDEAIAEGIVEIGSRFGILEWDYLERQPTPRAAFLHLITKINDLAPSANPWVWVVSFRPRSSSPSGDASGKE